jgi:hypothetical protein
MTPKEKAKELYNKFYMAIPSDEMGLSDEASRQCALIAVDEIIKANPYERNKTDMDSTIDYWQEVKQSLQEQINILAK